VLALNTYCRAFAIAGTHLGVWCPEAPSVFTGKPFVRLLCFDPEQLQAFPLEDVAGWFKQSNDRIYAATPPVAEFEITSELPPGDHVLEVPAEFRGADELLIVSPLAAATRDDASCAILIVNFQHARLQVLPQRWFTAARFDSGYQWITRVARDPLTRRIIGEGVRIKRFELTEDGTGLERWLE
jgi:hypothetical protein